MKFITKKMWLLMAAVAVSGLTSEARAYTQSKGLDIHVSITASKSLAVNTTYYDFGALAVNATVVSASSITVTNDSGGLIETYTIQGASATAVGTGTDWVLASSAGTDQYALSAQFSDPGNIQAAWTNDALTYSAVACTDEVFGNTTHGEAGYQVAYNGVRGLWFRIKTPTAITDGAEHKATITLAVQ